jgi:superoxide reductase
MTELMQVYKCDICGNIVEVIHTGKGELVCCGQPMVHQAENTVDAAREKHVPVIEVLGDSVKITIGSVLHPMEEKHYIEWIELIVDGKSCRKFLKSGELPVAEFCVPGGSQIEAREYCNLHGAWKTKL